MRLPRILLVLATYIFLQGCIKYTPSREELENDRGSDPSLTANLGSEEEFNAYERSLTERLQRLIADRSYLLTASQSINGYAVGPGDLIAVDVYGFGDLRAEAEVSPSGTLSLPLIGETDVKGRDISSLKRHLTGLYSRYVRNPRIDVSIKNYHSNRVSVIGEVQRPGMYPLRRNGQLITELISEAGGKNQMASSRIILLPAPKLDYIAQTAHPSHAPLTPSDAGVGVEIDIEALLGRIDQRPLLIPLIAGDTVVVPEAGNYEVDGEVQAPGSFKLTSGTSVIGAIAAAGGFTYSANVKQVEVIRDIGGGRKALATLDLEEVGLRGGKDIRLRAGDLVRVPSEPGRFFERQMVEALNSLFNGVSVNRRTN
ncbi:MAG: polysaccharide export protein EpsE [Pseudomonadota bacterium]|jgi:polysaccharide export outer membrane protein